MFPTAWVNAGFQPPGELMLCRCSRMVSTHNLTRQGTVRAIPSTKLIPQGTKTERHEERSPAESSCARIVILGSRRRHVAEYDTNFLTSNDLWPSRPPWSPEAGGAGAAAAYAAASAAACSRSAFLASALSFLNFLSSAAVGRRASRTSSDHTQLHPGIGHTCRRLKGQPRIFL